MFGKAAKVSNFVIITSGKHAAPVLVYHHLPVALLTLFHEEDKNGCFVEHGDAYLALTSLSRALYPELVVLLALL